MDELVQVCEAITLTDADTDSTIMDKVSERIGRKILAVHWYGRSGHSVTGKAFLSVQNGGENEQVTFVAVPNPGVGGVFQIGRKWVVPYIETLFDLPKLYREAEAVAGGKRGH